MSSQNIRCKLLESVDVTLFGKRIFADVIKDIKTGRLSWIYTFYHILIVKGKTTVIAQTTEKELISVRANTAFLSKQSIYLGVILQLRVVINFLQNDEFPRLRCT